MLFKFYNQQENELLKITDENNLHNKSNLSKIETKLKIKRKDDLVYDRL